MTGDRQSACELELSAAVDGWVAAFDRQIEENGDFATAVAAMKADGCFDVRAVVERWVITNPTGAAPVAQVPPAPQELESLQPVLEERPDVGEAAAAPDPAAAPERISLRPQGAAAPDIAYFHSLLQGGIERAQLDEAFPAFSAVIEEAVGQFEAAAPILSDAARGPSREDLDGEIRGIRQELQASRKVERRRWRRD
jgi:hypothetical protein